MVLLRGDRFEVVPKLTPLIPFGIYGKDTFRFTDFLEEEIFRLRHKNVARKERGRENPGKEHLPVKEHSALTMWISWPW